MVTYISPSPEQTQDLGEACGRSAHPGDVIALSGDLGAGKTQWVKGLARGLEFHGRVHSPTFALVNVYEGGRLPVFHLDLYRLETSDQILAAGLEEYLRPSGVTVIEWAERWDGLGGLAAGREGNRGDEGNQGAPRARVRWVRIEAISEGERRITYL